MPGESPDYVRATNNTSRVLCYYQFHGPTRSLHTARLILARSQTLEHGDTSRIALVNPFLRGLAGLERVLVYITPAST